MTVLELGGGIRRHALSSKSLDLHHPFPAGDPYTDVGRDRWPVEDESVGLVYCSHLLEHIPKGEPIIHVFNEALRVLKVGGRFVAVFPCIGYTDLGGMARMVVGWQPYADPTHVQGWWMPESVQYMTRQVGAEADYGINKGWLPLGRQISEVEGAMEMESVRTTSEPLDYNTWWSINGGWEAAFSLLKVM